MEVYTDGISLTDEKLHQIRKNSGKAFSFSPDDGSGQVEVWRVENFNLVPVSEEMVGMFFSGDSYIVKYTYQNENGQTRYIFYFWLVR